ncbi:MAG: hypothetical protein IKU80_05025 [Firmicutes bacterium]|nr:hypothetical protein [Bacillota bacterium]
MGLFSKNKTAQEIQYFTCTSCGKMVTEDNFNHDAHMCSTCAMVSESFKLSFMSTIEGYQKQADEASDTEAKILYLKLKLNYLYEYKINYFNKGIYLMTDDIEGFINDTIDQISKARL